MGDPVERVKKLLRSVLLSSKAGVKATRLQGEYQELSGSYIPHDKFGYSSLHEFLLTLTDVVRIGKNKENELTYYAIADSTTQHIQSMVSKQKSKPVKKAASSFCRNQKKPIISSKFNPNFNRKPKFQNFTVSKFGKNNNFSNFKKNMASNHNTNRAFNASHVKEDKQFMTQKENNHSSFQTNVNVDKVNTSHNMPLRLSNKTKSPKPLQGAGLYKNPLGAPSKDLNSEKAKFVKQPKIEINERNFVGGSPLKDSDSQFVLNLKKLLSVNRNGIHSDDLPMLYKDAFKQHIPSNLLKSLITGNGPKCVSIEKVFVNNQEKIIFFPVTENTAFKNPSSKYRPLSSSSLIVDHHTPLVAGKDYEAIITHFESCNKFFVQLLSEADNFKKMQTLLKTELKTSCTNERKLKPGDYVVSCGNRAKVKSVGDEIEIYHIDESDSTHSYFVAPHQLYLMPPFISIYPEFCVCCSMLRPFNKGSVWSSDSNQRFEDLYHDQKIVIKPVSVSSVSSFNSEDLYQQHSVYCYSGVNQVNINSKLSSEEKEFAVWNNDPFKYQPNNYASLPDEEYCDVYVFNASCTTEIDVCVIKEGYSDELVKLEEDMFKYYTKSNLRPPQNLPIDCVYAVLSEDTCRRGKLVAVEQGKADVYLVDNAEYCRVSASDLCPLIEKFCLLPVQVITIALAGLEHESLSNHSSVLQKLNDTVVFETCTARIVGKLQTKSRKVCCVVELLDTHGPTDVSINQLCWDIIFDEKLIPAVPTIGNKCDAIISSVDLDSDCVFIQLPGEGKIQLDKCMLEIQNTFTKQKFHPSRCAVDLYPGKLCLASLASGVYRVRISEIIEGKPRGILVILVDNGSYEHVARGMLFKLEEENCLSLPPQAICCKLSKIKSVEEQHLLLKDALLSDKFLPVEMRVDETPDFQSQDSYLVSLWTKSGVRIVRDSTVILEEKEKNNNLEPVSLEGISYPSKLSAVNTESSSDDLPSDVQILSAKTPDDLSGQQLMHSKENYSSFAFDKKMHTPIDLFDTDLVKDTFAVKVEDAISPGFLHIIPFEHIPARDVLTTAISRYYEKKTLLKQNNIDLTVGLVFALRSPQDNHWYRVKILSKMVDAISVYLIDYGDCRVVDGRDLFELDEQFQYISGMMMTAKLCGIQSLGEDKNTWSGSICERFCKMVKGNCYYAHILKVINEPVFQHRKVFHVCLCDTTSTSDIWINDLLVDEWKCATYIK